jgi:cell division protein FtsW
LLLAQPNTSTTLVISIAAAALYFIAGAPLRDFAIIVTVALLGVGVLVGTRPYLMHRVETFIHPQNNWVDSTEF